MKVRNIPKELLNSKKVLAISPETFEMPALWFESGIIYLIDQRLLPNKFGIYQVKNYEEAAYAIRDMVVRGAPAIGAMAAYAIAQAVIQNQNIDEVSDKILSARPTAFDLFYSVKYMQEKLNQGENPTIAAEDYVKMIVDKCRKIGEFGNELIQDGNKILTHCNAGALATVDYGTALAPIRMAHNQGKKIFVFVDETRPRLQGAKLTAWELYNEGIPHALIVDNAAGFYFSRGEIDIVITGADRIASNGDAANKIGTYEKAVLAHENDVPFYIAAPKSTFDLSISEGTEIPIEERTPEEVLLIDGTAITNKGVKAYNPAFDITPNKYITGFITEFGVIKPNDVKDIIMKGK